MKICKQCNIREALPTRAVCGQCRNENEKAARVARKDSLRSKPCNVDGCTSPRAETPTQIRPVCADHYRERMREVNRKARRKAGLPERTQPKFPKPDGLTLLDGYFWCTGCGESKPREEFHKQGDHTNGVTAHCRDCSNKARRDRYNGPDVKYWREVSRRSALKTRVVRAYPGWNFASREDYEARRASASCEICGLLHTDDDPLVPDHSHETGAGRGWLCGSCNRGLGQFRDRPETLRAAADYLEHHASLSA